MTSLKASDARREFFRILDAVEGGEEVVLERRGVRFRVVLEGKQPGRKPPPKWKVDDPDVLSGQWSWTSDEDGRLQFRPGDEP